MPPVLPRPNRRGSGVRSILYGNELSQSSWLFASLLAWPSTALRQILAPAHPPPLLATARQLCRNFLPLSIIGSCD